MARDRGRVQGTGADPWRRRTRTRKRGRTKLCVAVGQRDARYSLPVRQRRGAGARRAACWARSTAMQAPLALRQVGGMESGSGGLMTQLGSHLFDAAGMFMAAVPNRKSGEGYPLSVAASGSQLLPDCRRRRGRSRLLRVRVPGQGLRGERPAQDPQEDRPAVRPDRAATSSTATARLVLGTEGTLVLDSEQEALLYKVAATTTKTPRGGAKEGGPKTKAETPMPPGLDPKESGDEAVGRWSASTAHDRHRRRASPPNWSIGPGASATRRRRTSRAAMPKTAWPARSSPLAAGQAVKKGMRIDFKKEWFDPNSDETPRERRRTIAGLCSAMTRLGRCADRAARETIVESVHVDTGACHGKVAAGSLCQHRRRAGRPAGSGPRVGRADRPTPRPAQGEPHAGAGRASSSARLERAGHPHHAWSSAASRARATPTSPPCQRTVGLVPPETRAARLAGDEGDRRFRPAAGRGRGGAAHRLRAARRGRPALPARCSPSPATCATTASRNGQRLHLETGPGNGRHAAAVPRRRRTATTCSSTSIRPT